LTNFVKVAFLRRTSLRSVPANPKPKDTRTLDIHEDDQFDEAQLAAWVKQASLLPGEGICAGSCEVRVLPQLVR
jgi:hypothetical protein